MTHGLIINNLYRHPRYGVVRVKDVKGESTFIEYATNGNGERRSLSFTSVNHKHLVPHESIVGKIFYDINTLKSVEILNEYGNDILVRDKNGREYIVSFCYLKPNYRECIEANLRNQDRNDRIVRCLKNGDSINNIATKFVVDKALILTIARSHGLELNNKQTVNKEISEKIKLAKTDIKFLSYDEIKAKHSLTDDMMILSGIKDKIERQKEVNKILSMYKEDYTLKEIADYFDCSCDKISRLVRLHNAHKNPLLSMSVEERKNFTDKIRNIIVDKFNNGLSDEFITLELNEEGYKTLFGTEFTLSYIRKITKDLVVNKPVKEKEVREKDYLDFYLKNKKKKSKV